MSSTQPIISFGDASKQQPVTPSIRVYSEPIAAGWSSTNFAFQGENVATSTLFEVPRTEETQSRIMWFAQGGAADPRDLSAIVFLHDSFAQKSAQTATGALTTMSIQSTDPVLTALRSFESCLILKPTSIQNWMERYRNHSADQQLQLIRKMFPLELKKKDRFAKLNVGAAKQYVVNEHPEKKVINFIEDGSEEVPSHCLTARPYSTRSFPRQQDYARCRREPLQKK